MAERFTIDGSVNLEQRLAQICDRVRSRVLSIIPEKRIEALALGGGYGRGEGGVFRLEGQDAPYNDLEFYLFVRGNRIWNERKYRALLEHLGEEMSGPAGVHVEFKVDALSRLRTCKPSMYTYDLLSGHKLLVGRGESLAGCSHHLVAESIPLSEGTRLLVNRCSGLLLAQGFLQHATLTPEESDFVGRNLAKASLAVGDAVLTGLRQYHWSCLERRRRLAELSWPDPPVNLEHIRARHASGVQFKLHPFRFDKSVAEFHEDLKRLISLSLDVWLWLERVRLDRPFSSLEEYACSPIRKCTESSIARNLFLNLRTYGVSAAFDPWVVRYPRERLFASLPLLLSGSSKNSDPGLQRRLQRTLHASACDWHGLVTAYKQIWPSYG